MLPLDSQRRHHQLKKKVQRYITCITDKSKNIPKKSKNIPQNLIAIINNTGAGIEGQIWELQYWELWGRGRQIQVPNVVLLTTSEAKKLDFY